MIPFTVLYQEHVPKYTREGRLPYDGPISWKPLPGLGNWMPDDAPALTIENVPPQIVTENAIRHEQALRMKRDRDRRR